MAIIAIIPVKTRKEGKTNKYDISYIIHVHAKDHVQKTTLRQVVVDGIVVVIVVVLGAAAVVVAVVVGLVVIVAR